MPQNRSRGIKFFAPGTPAPGGSKTAFFLRGRIRVIDACKRNKPWRELVGAYAAKAMAGRCPLLGPLSLQVIFLLPRPKSHMTRAGQLRPAAPIHHTIRPDATKLLRALEDACTGIVWHDDAQIEHQVVTKRWCNLGDESGAYVSVRNTKP